MKALDNSKIDWELVDCLETISVHDQTWSVEGFDGNSQKYTAIASVSCGEIVEVTDIEIA